MDKTSEPKVVFSSASVEPTCVVHLIQSRAFFRYFNGLGAWQLRGRTQDATFSLSRNPPPSSCISHGGRPDEVQIVVANSELAIERGDFDKALLILGDVPPESPAYVRVQVPGIPYGLYAMTVNLQNNAVQTKGVKV